MHECETKAEWRAWAKTVERSGLSERVNCALIDWAPLHGTVLSYLALGDEVNVARVHDVGRCRVAITRTPEGGPLSVHEYEPGRLEMHPLGFAQPSADSRHVPLDEIDVVLVISSNMTRIY